MSPTREVHEKSCGVIVFHKKKEGGHEYLLLHYPGGHWDFPKGHVEEYDDSEMATALRELEEETGITDVAILPDYHESMYYEFDRGRKERVKKTVIYFLAEAMATEVKISFEHKNFTWLSFEEAVKRLTFGNAKDLLKMAEEHLSLQGS